VSINVHLTTVHVPFDTRIFYKECCTLARAGYRVALITTHTQHETVDGIEIVPLPRYSRRLARMTLGTWAAFRIARRLRGNVYHFHDPELLPVGVLLKWTTRARVIYDAHENYAKQLSSRGWLHPTLRRLVPRLAGLVEQASVRTFDAVVCATEHIAASFPHSRTLVVKNYPLLDLASLMPDERPYRPDNDRIIYTGGWSPHRGVYQIVQALGHVQTPGCRLVVLGRCVDAHVKEKAERLPGFSRVDYPGMLPYDKLYEEMRSAAIGLVCNQPEHDFDRGQPNKLFEYMSAGLPVIASDFPLWRQVVEGNNCGINVDPTRPELIAQAIDRLLADPGLRKQMGDNGRQAVLSTYNWDVEGKKLVNLYEEFLS
jgi:glycosyltransferase involved in cell wall biosynthesis